MTIVVVEDDDMQISVIESQLKKAFPDQKIRKVTSEIDFRDQFEEIARESPDVFIIDVMLRWTRPREPKLPSPPEDIRRQGPTRAGFRCRDLVVNDNRTKDTPIILYSVLDSLDVAHELNQRGTTDVFVQKRSNPAELIGRVREFLQAESRVNRQ